MSGPSTVEQAARSLHKRVTRWRQPGTVVIECRHCGTTLKQDATDCPRCEYDGIARYDI